MTYFIYLNWKTVFNLIKAMLSNFTVAKKSTNIFIKSKKEYLNINNTN